MAKPKVTVKDRWKTRNKKEYYVSIGQREVGSYRTRTEAKKVANARKRDLGY